MQLQESAAFLARTEDFLRGVIAPQAMVLDQSPELLFQAVQALGQRQLLALKVGQQWGGQDLDALTFRQFQEQVSRYSGALAFLQTQHQSAASLIAQSANTDLQAQYLPHMGSGKVLIGIGFSHLRRQNPAPVSANPTTSGYVINGEVPWVTGYGCFQHFIVGAQLPDGQAVFGLVPLATQSQTEGGTLTCSAALPLAVMASTQTVRVQFRNWSVSKAQIVVIRPSGWIHINDQKNSLHHSFFALGSAQAGLDIVANASSQLPDFVDATRQGLAQELQICRSAIYQEQQVSKLTRPERLKLRAWAIALANRCAPALSP